EEVNREVSERVYLFRSNQDAVELSVASEIISALRNKKIYIKRLYYPREIEETVKQVFGGG
ncbi:MAG: HD domain-containing protein, partial [Bacillota bacterium]|nr:HD domain-containing protein [Bacillota bacterium]